MKLFKTIPLLTLISCGSAVLAPPEVRTVKFDETVSADKSAVYTSSLAYIAKSFGDANHVVKMQDKDSGMIILKGNTLCNTLRQFGDPNDYSLQFTLTVKADNKKLKLSFEDLVMIDRLGNPFNYDYNQMTDASKVEKVKGCLLPIKDKMVASIN